MPKPCPSLVGDKMENRALLPDLTSVADTERLFLNK